MFFPVQLQYDPWFSFCNKRIYLPHIFIFMIYLGISLQLKGYIHGLTKNSCMILWWASIGVMINVIMELWSCEIEDTRIVFMLLHIAVSYLIFRSYLLKLMYEYCVLLDSHYIILLHIVDRKLLLFNPSWTIVHCMHNFIKIPTLQFCLLPRVIPHIFYQHEWWSWTLIPRYEDGKFALMHHIDTSSVVSMSCILVCKRNYVLLPADPYIKITFSWSQRWVDLWMGLTVYRLTPSVGRDEGEMSPGRGSCCWMTEPSLLLFAELVSSCCMMCTVLRTMVWWDDVSDLRACLRIYVSALVLGVVM